MLACSHDGFHSGVGRYCNESHRLRYVMVCDHCGTELAEVHVEQYSPAFDPAGNQPYLRAA
jgi:phage terminase large subunit GpA-like protein